MSRAVPWKDTKAGKKNRQAWTSTAYRVWQCGSSIIAYCKSREVTETTAGTWRWMKMSE